MEYTAEQLRSKLVKILNCTDEPEKDFVWLCETVKNMIFLTSDLGGNIMPKDEELNDKIVDMHKELITDLITLTQLVTKNYFGQ